MSNQHINTDNNSNCCESTSHWNGQKWKSVKKHSFYWQMYDVERTFHWATSCWMFRKWLDCAYKAAFPWCSSSTRLDFQWLVYLSWDVAAAVAWNCHDAVIKWHKWVQSNWDNKKNQDFDTSLHLTTVNLANSAGVWTLGLKSRTDIWHWEKVQLSNFISEFGKWFKFTLTACGIHY